ncbi:hypothetical protein P9695_08825 [Weizmannia sp. CD-2023]|uniref:hypothetical protein n=1 Tax=Heyndrickxia TaxID=2837504 RepID=UPI002E1D7A50|nr:hypothetical protein [Weizmannia sp. CD-2023]MED4899724.1 hypothetical protein [Weizmannia sp. CD-2023]
MVKVGDKIQATGFGEFFSAILLGFSGRGIVIYVHGAGNLEDRFKELVEETINFERINEGIIYIDEQSHKACWLADGDYEVIQSA